MASGFLLGSYRRHCRGTSTASRWLVRKTLKLRSYASGSSLGTMTVVSMQRYAVTRTIAARPDEIFAVLADPGRHRDTEPGDWVRDAVDPTPITGVGQIFVMNMHLTQAGGDYVTHNLVNVFDQGRAIGWLPGRLDSEGNHSPGGWWWRYDLAANADKTDVTLTYDWTDTPQEFRDQIGGMPPFPENYLVASLVTLERTVTNG